LSISGDLEVPWAAGVEERCMLVVVKKRLPGSNSRVLLQELIWTSRNLNDFG